MIFVPIKKMKGGKQRRNKIRLRITVTWATRLHMIHKPEVVLQCSSWSLDPALSIRATNVKFKQEIFEIVEHDVYIHVQRFQRAPVWIWFVALPLSTLASWETRNCPCWLHCKTTSGLCIVQACRLRYILNLFCSFVVFPASFFLMGTNIVLDILTNFMLSYSYYFMNLICTTLCIFSRWFLRGSVKWSVMGSVFCRSPN